jgi:hypothetical protein
MPLSAGNPLRKARPGGARTRPVSPGPVGGTDLALWQDVNAEIRSLAQQRGLRFVAVAVLAPFGVSGIGREEDGSGPGVGSVVFGVTLLFLAIAELASMAQSALWMRRRADLEERHPALRQDSKPGRLARLLAFVSGPGFSTALYALLGAAFIVGGSLPFI